jgi:DNA topoisomerase-6 subunit B
MEAVQRKMNIYGKYLPLIAQFSTELAGKKELPRYRKLIGEGMEAPEEPVAEAPTEEAGAGESDVENTKEDGQKTIDEYGGS